MISELTHPEDHLGQSFDCICGRTHDIPLRRLVYADDALEQLPEICRGFTSESETVVLADERTWAVAGRRVVHSLEKRGWSAVYHVVPDSTGRTPVCDDRTHTDLLENLPKAALIIAVGSGVINDLAKWVAFERDVPYVVVATAASMNGYAAANVAPSVNGVKMLIRARSPLAVFAEPPVIAAAPYELTASGFGDILAKPISTADWKMNHLLLDEHFCPVCSDIFASVEPLYLQQPEKIRQRDPQAIEALFRASVYSGIAMTLVGTSAPASGGEHLLSHTLDMLSAVDHQSHDLHGRQVGLGTIFAAAVYQKLMEIERPVWLEMPAEIDWEFWGPSAEAVAGQFEQKRTKLARIRENVSHPKNWRSLKDNLRAHLRRPGVIREVLGRVGAAACAADIGCDSRRLHKALAHMHEIRSRPTVIDLAWISGILPDQIESLMEEWLL